MNGSFVSGTVVDICGLKQRSELNGSKACILKWDASTMRYTAITLSDSKMYSLKAANITKSSDCISDAFASVMTSALRGAKNVHN